MWKPRLRAVAAYAALSLGCTVSAFYLTGQFSTGSEELTFVSSLFATRYFLVFFAAGALLAIEPNYVSAKVATAPHWLKILPFVVVALCLENQWRL